MREGARLAIAPRFKLAQIRVKAGYKTAQDAADLLGISRVHLLGIERGKGGPSEDLLQRMATLYRMDPLELMGKIRNAQRRLWRRQLEGDRQA